MTMILDVKPTERNVIELTYAQQEYAPSTIRLNFRPYPPPADPEQVYVKLDIKDGTLVATRPTGGRVWLSLAIVESIRVYWQLADPGPCPF